MQEILVTYALEIAASLAITLIGVFGAWLTAKLAKRQELTNITAATEQVIHAAQMTVEELQQTLVDGWKAEGGGKLTEEQVERLGQLLLEKTSEKMAAPALALLEAAKVDVTAVIIGAGESWLNSIKRFN